MSDLICFSLRLRPGSGFVILNPFTLGNYLLLLLTIIICVCVFYVDMYRPGQR